EINKERLELALEAAGLDLWENDLVSGKVTRKASKIFSELGYSKNEALAYVDDLFAILHPDDAPLVKAAIADHLNGKTAQYRSEFRVRSKSGEWVWYANYGKIMDLDGRRFIGVTFNIDDRKRSEERLRSIIEAIPVPLALNDDLGNITYLNRAFVLTLGYTLSDIPDLDRWWPKAYPDPEYRNRVAEGWQKNMDESRLSGKPFAPMEIDVTCKDGGMRTFLASPSPFGKGFEDVHLVVLFDVTERKASEARIERLGRLYKALSEVNQAIVRMETEETLFPLVCRMAVDFGGLKMAWVGQFEEKTGLIATVANYGNGSEYLAKIAISANEALPEGRGPTGKAFRENCSVIVNNYLESDFTRPWHRQASRFGWKSSATFPIRRGGKPFAVMTVYHDEEDAFDEETIDLLDEMVTDVSFALDSFDRERLRRQAETDLVSSEHHFRAYFERSMVGMAATSPDKGWLEVNDTLCKILGYSRGELLNMTWADVTHPDDMEASSEAARRISSGEIREFELDKRFLKKNGDVVYAHVAVRAVYNDGGQVDYYVVLVDDVTDKWNQQRQLEMLVHHDTLTGLPNRVLLGDRLDMGLAQVKRAGGNLAVCFMDLDGFKPVNDTFGHAVGDLLLVEVAKRMVGISRPTDTVARLGGDEFVLIFSSVYDEEDCRQLLYRIMEAIGQPFEISGQFIRISASIGVAMYPDDVTDGDNLLRHADQAMYIAKQSGRNRIHFFDAVNDHLAQVRSEGLSRVEMALESGELALHYQPKVNMRSGKVIGMEALIRWQHPERGLVPPGEFLPMIENSDFEIMLSEWVVSQGMEQAAAWRREGLDMSVSVNLPARHLQSKGFSDFISSVVSEYPDLGKNALELEILETAALGDMSSVIHKMEACIGLGVCFAIDDFGTGYASLAYLRRL
ncbi:MAG TPA: diguanylate cyclase, partial [Burkholderiales bacterium]|nr:diguanylate cyclase [Burkholderiales bacterium]